MVTDRQAAERPRPSLQGWRGWIEAIVFQIGLFGALLVGAFVAMRLISLPPTHVTVIWLPAGIAVLALRSRHAAPSIATIALAHWAIVALANDYPFLSFRPWSLVMAAANTAGPVIGAWIWRRWITEAPFRDNGGFLKFVLGVAIIPSLLTAWVIPAVILVAGYLPDMTILGFMTRVGSISLSSVLGVFLLVPIACTPWAGGLLQRPGPLWLGHSLNAIAALTIAFIGFHLTPLGLYLAIPYTMLAAVVCGPRGLGWGLLLFTIYGLLATAEGMGPFAGSDKAPVTSLFEMAGAVLCLGVPGFFSGLTLNELWRHRKKLESTVSTRTRELSESEERYRFATEAVSEGIFDWQAGREVSFFNPAIRQKMGEAIQQDRANWLRVMRLIHPDDRSEISHQVHAVMRGPADVFRLEGRLRTSTGAWCWFRARGKVVARNNRQRAQRVVGTFSDIDTEKRRLIELTEARNDADSRGRAKDTFLANMSHEIRTPMHAMLGFARMLDASALDEKQRECIDAILSSGDLLLELLNDLLDLSRIEAGAIQLETNAANFPDAIRQTFKLFESPARQKQIGITLQITEDLPEQLVFDRLRVHQVVSNLLSNAVKFTTTGQVGLAVRASPVKGQVSPVTWHISIEVSDTGIGISDDQIERLFNPFVQADSSITRRFGGSGLGLAISQRLCELMGGTISVNSKAGHGSVFTAVFLAQEVAAEAKSSASKPTRQPENIPEDSTANNAHSRLRILVVEDNRLNRRLADIMLQKLGHDATFAENGMEALPRLEATAFDLILMDLQMPELDGFETTRAIRRQEASDPARRRIPIIALTANAENEERQRCLTTGMDDFLTKPLDLATLQNALNRVSCRDS